MAKQIDLKALLESRMGEIEPAEGSRVAIEGAEMNIPKTLCLMRKAPNLSQKRSL